MDARILPVVSTSFLAVALVVLSSMYLRESDVIVALLALGVALALVQSVFSVYKCFFSPPKKEMN